MIYDKAYRVEESTDVTTIEFEDYSKIIDYALNDIALAISAAPSLKMPIHVSFSLNKDEFTKLANSFRAKILMGKKRGGDADETNDYSQVISWLDQGITSILILQQNSQYYTTIVKTG